MTNANEVRRAHDVVDVLFAGRILSRENEQLLRSFLPELPKQKTLEEIAAHVYDAWIRSSGYEWAGNIDNPEVPIEEWLAEIHTQLKGLKDDAEPAKPAHPEFLETEADYTNAPEGTVVASSGRFPWVKGAASGWACSSSTNSDFAMSKIGRRNVLRWGWGE